MLKCMRIRLMGQTHKLIYQRIDVEMEAKSQWQGANINRYCDPAYDALLDKLSAAGDLKRGEIGIQLNNILTKDSYTIAIAWESFSSRQVLGDGVKHIGLRTLERCRLVSYKVNFREAQLKNCASFAFRCSLTFSDVY